MIDIAPILAFLALIVGPVLAARLVTRGDPVDLPSVVATVLEPAPEEGVHGMKARPSRPDLVQLRRPAGMPGDASDRRRLRCEPEPR